MKKPWAVTLVMLCHILISTAEITDETIEHAAHSSAQEPHFIDGAHNEHYDHKAVLGSMDLDNEYSKLPADEAKRRLGILVDKMDLNRDGFVSKEELSDWVLKSFRALDAEEALKKMKDHDRDGDGNVTWAEYLDVVYGFQPEDVRDFKHDKDPHVADLGEMIALDMEKFIAADVNDDRVLDQSEYPPFMHPYDFAHMHDSEVKRILRTYDKDKSGDIDLNEFMQLEDFPHEVRRDKLEDTVDMENFQYHDVNKDGTLDTKEIMAWALPDNAEAADDEAYHLIEASDVNRDGKLSKEEILEKHTMWVGSSATDYGQHLHDAGEL